MFRNVYTVLLCVYAVNIVLCLYKRIGILIAVYFWLILFDAVT